LAIQSFNDVNSVPRKDDGFDAFVAFITFDPKLLDHLTSTEPPRWTLDLRQIRDAVPARVPFKIRPGEGSYAAVASKAYGSYALATGYTG